MNKLLIATAAVAFATVGTAGAADLPTKAPPMVAAAPAPTWTGCWISGGVGYGMWNQDVSLTGNLLNTAGTAVIGTVNTVTTTDGGRGWLGRVGVGCDYQFSQQFLIGAFGDFDWTNIKGTNLPNEVFIGNVISPVAYDVKERNSAAAGLRLGYLPYPNLLTFVSGGWTRAKFTESADYLTLNGAALGTGYGDYSVNGWFIGGGYEYRLPWWNGLTWKTEYRFNQYQTVNLAETFVGTGLLTGNVVHNQSFVQTVTTSLVWRFNWGGPVVARY
jgi:outer membrane immunogenic protein